MNALHTFATASAVASCTLAAAHRRDHDHGLEVVACHPHVVEVVHLGERAAMICHDCGEPVSSDDIEFRVGPGYPDDVAPQLDMRDRLAPGTPVKAGTRRTPKQHPRSAVS